MKKTFLITLFAITILLSIGCSSESITEEQKVKIIEIWFDSPYEYMFEPDYSENAYSEDEYYEGEPYTGEGDALKYFMEGKYSYIAGTQGILDYGNLHGAFEEVFNLNADVYGTIETLSGIKCFTNEDDEDAKFSHLNPKIVKWLYAQLPAKTLSVKGYACEQIYKTIFSNVIHMYVAAYYYVNFENDKDEIIKEYEKVMYTDDYNLDKLEDLYLDALPDYPDYYDGTALTAPMTIGFWVRREIDGSADELWKYLQKFMNEYDKEWFDKNKK